MPKASKRCKYSGVTLPEPLIRRVETFIKERPELGYSSIADFIKDAVREKFEKHEDHDLPIVLLEQLLKKDVKKQIEK
jgi:metal-responsive CopG/Arc/MetJ family transcriptional regulator